MNSPDSLSQEEQNRFGNRYPERNPHKELGDIIRVVSLGSLMFEYAINDLVMGVSGLLAASSTLKSTSDPLMPVDGRRLKNMGGVLSGLVLLGREIGLDVTLLHSIEELRKDVELRPEMPTMTIKTRVDGIIQGIHLNLNSKKFMFMPGDQASHWDNPAIFGNSFSIEFPEAARIEALEAGNCFAAGRWTACVFHSMRVAEYGLRKLAKTLKVEINDKGKRCPIEYGDWDKVITAIRNKLSDLRKVSAGPKKAGLLSSYSNIVDHCEYMKDIWRNEVSHTRRLWDKTESLGVMTRVREFIQSLPVKSK
jgi:hypothetical protein